MTNLVDNLTLGIIGGLVATLLVVIFAKFWKKLIIPWFEKGYIKMQSLKVYGIVSIKITFVEMRL